MSSLSRHVLTLPVDVCTSMQKLPEHTCTKKERTEGKYYSLGPANGNVKHFPATINVHVSIVENAEII